MLGYLGRTSTVDSSLLLQIYRQCASLRNHEINTLLNELHIQRYSDVFRDDTLAPDLRSPMRFCILTRRTTPRSMLTKQLLLPHENNTYTVTPEHSVQPSGFSSVSNFYVATAYDNYIQPVVHKALSDSAVPCSVSSDIQEIIRTSTRCKALDVLRQVQEDESSYVLNPSATDLLAQQQDWYSVILTKDADSALQTSYQNGLLVKGTQIVWFPPALQVKSKAVFPAGSRALKAIRALPTGNQLKRKYGGVGAPSDVSSAQVLMAFPTIYEEKRYHAKLALKEFILNDTMSPKFLPQWEAACTFKSKSTNLLKSNPTTCQKKYTKKNAGGVQILEVGEDYTLPFKPKCLIYGMPAVLHSYEVLAALREAKKSPRDDGVAVLAFKRTALTCELQSQQWSLYMLDTKAPIMDVAKFIGQANHS